MTTAPRTHFVPLEDLTEEVVFPLVRRRRPVSLALDEVGAPPDEARLRERRIVVVQAIGLSLFLAAFAFLVLAWLVA